MADRVITLSVNGAAGRMGKSVLRLAHANPAIRIQEALEHAGSQSLGTGALAGAGVGVKAGEDVAITSRHAGADVMIDFSLPVGFQARLAECVERKTAFVSGTTGLSDADRDALKRAASSIPILHAPNFSVGVNLLCKLVADAARTLADYDIEIVEMHHNQKKDSPSGTADRLLRVVCETLNRDAEKDTRHGRVGDVGARTSREIGMHALRGGDVVGDHTVIFATQGERVELTHKASSRDTFAAGALRAALALVGRQPGLYEIDQVLFGR